MENHQIANQFILGQTPSDDNFVSHIAALMSDSTEPSTDDLAPQHHIDPVLDDPSTQVPNWKSIFNFGAIEGHEELSSETASSEENFFSHISALMDDTTEPSPDESAPWNHMEPELSDPSILLPNWKAIFSADLQLTDAQEGLRSQKLNRNISEISEAIHNRCNFMSISGQLAVYQPPCWHIMTREESLRFVKSSTERLFPDEAKFLNDRQYREIVSQLQYDSRTVLLKKIPAPDTAYLCCRDSMYHWKSGHCYAHNSSYLRFSYLNLDAKSIGNCDGTNWEMFLENLTDGDCSLRQRILEMIGVILSGYPTKSFFFLEGESGTGKSQLVNFLRDVLGESSCVALNDISQLGQKWTTGSIFSKNLCLCGDMPDAPLDSKTIGTIKQLTGDDLIRGEFKYRDAFSFENTAKLLFVSNYPLRIPSQSREHALLERLVTIPCHNPIPRERQIPSLHKILHQEAGYIVGLSLDALEQLISRNLIFTEIPDSFSAVQFQLPDHEEIITDFIQECCLLEDDASCPVKEVYQAFQSYFPDVKIDRAQFSKILCRLYPQIKRDRSSTARKYCGLRLADS